MLRYPLLALLALFASCETFDSRSQVRFADDLTGDVVVETPLLERTADNLLRVSVPLRNVSDRDLQLLVQIEFLDPAGNRYNDETPRRVMFLSRGQTGDFTAESMLAKADDFVAHIWRNR